MKSKQAQVTIFIILGLIVIGLLILFFALKKDVVLPTDSAENPQLYVESCAKDEIKEKIDLMTLQGGFLDPKNYKIYQDNKATYLCYSSGSLLKCTTQHPLLLREIQQEILDNSETIIQDCFTNLKKSLENKNINIKLGSSTTDVSLVSEGVNIDVKRKITIEDKEGTKIYEGVEINIISDIYDLANVAIEISNQKAKYCEVDYNSYILLHPEFEIRKFVMSDATEIYTIKKTDSNQEMNIAVRGCVNL